MSDLAKQEVLLSAYDALTRAQSRVAMGDVSADALRAEVSALNRLYDAALDCGMSRDEPSTEAWATEAVTRFLVEA